MVLLMKEGGGSVWSSALLSGERAGGVCILVLTTYTLESCPFKIIHKS